MKYGYLVGVMPGFEINSDPTLIKKEVLENCLEYWIQDPTCSFSYRIVFSRIFLG